MQIVNIYEELSQTSSYNPNTRYHLSSHYPVLSPSPPLLVKVESCMTSLVQNHVGVQLLT